MDTTIEHTLAELERLWPGRFLLGKPFGQGTTNGIWHLEARDGPCVLRVHHLAEGLPVDRRLEARAWQQASQRRCAPELLYFDPRFSIARYGGEEPQSLDAALLASLLIILHGIELDLPRLQPLVLIEKYLQLGRAKLPAVITTRLPNWWKQVQQTVLAEGFCHMDLHRGNLLVDSKGQWQVVDFEYVHRAVPQFDLAPLLIAMPEQQGRGLWQDYLGRRGVKPSATEWQSMLACMALTCAMGWSWSLAQPGSAIAQSQAEYFQNKLEWLDKFVVS